MQLDFLRRRKAAIALAAAAAMTAGGIAHASIPDVHGVFWACYDQNRVILMEWGSCRWDHPGMNDTNWSQKGRTVRGPEGAVGPKGDTGDVGPTGATGPLGRNDIHWVVTRPGQYDSGFRSSEPGVLVWAGMIGARYIWIPDRDISRCSFKVTAQAPGADGATTTGDWTAPVVTGFFRYYGYLFAYANKVVTNSSGQATTTPIATELNLIAAC